jgi:hypothetical protein
MGFEPTTYSMGRPSDGNDSEDLEGRGQVKDRFTLARVVQERVAVGEAVPRAELIALAAAAISATRAGRMALAVLRSATDDERLSWALDLSGEVLAGIDHDHA